MLPGRADRRELRDRDRPLGPTRLEASTTGLHTIMGSPCLVVAPAVGSSQMHLLCTIVHNARRLRF
jgi:hypothetical protein